MSIDSPEVWAAADARPGMILFVQTFGDLASFNPHLHVLAADGVFGAGGASIALPAVPEALLAGGFRRAVLAYLVRQKAITDELRTKNRARGERAKALKAQQSAKTPPAAEAPVSEFATRAKATWARLIRKVYEADPLACPKCKGPMRVIAPVPDIACRPMWLEIGALST